MSFITDDFLLHTKIARRLYHEYAEGQPIIDYHCHINQREIAENRRFDTITQVWLGGDHYKWRLIRTNGIPEEQITGTVSDRTKFDHFVEMLPKAIGNPIYHWTHLELKRYFDYDGILCPETADEVWALCNERLQSPALSVCGIIDRSNVQMIGTTDDPIDLLNWHKKIAADDICAADVVPSFRPDKAINIDKPGFIEYIARLSAVAGRPIRRFSDVKNALADRLEFFCAHGCRASDHGLDYVPFAPATDNELEKIFDKVMNKGTLTVYEAEQYKTNMLLFLAREYKRHGVVMQLHYGAARNVNQSMFTRLGPDTGFDCISMQDCGEKLTAFFSRLFAEDMLPKTVLYSLDPTQNALIDTVIGCFQGKDAIGKIQHGAAWWFNDTKAGMEAQLRSLAELSLLGNFIGMLTDSRSFLSYTRHEYFRRILCDLIGKWVEDGEYPQDEKNLGRLVGDICYGNAVRYFGIPNKQSNMVNAKNK